MKRKPSKGSASHVLPGQLDLFAEVPCGRICEDMTLKLAAEKSRRVAAGLTKTTSAPGAKAKRSIASTPKTKADKIACTRIKEDEALLDTKEAARVLKLGVSTLEKMRGQKKGPRFLKLTNSTVRYKATDLEAWLEARARSVQGD